MADERHDGRAKQATIFATMDDAIAKITGESPAAHSTEEIDNTRDDA